MSRWVAGREGRRYRKEGKNAKHLAVIPSVS
jgi:hypothetical protein